MSETKTVKYLSEVINLKEDIEPYKLILIYSGVGSGKNHWVETLAKQGKSILFITSRKITAEVQAENINEIEMDLKKWHRNTIAGKPVGDKQYLISRTNAWVAHFAKNIYDPDDNITHIWKYFDFVFLDEAHSVAADAAFADSSFHVWRFMAWVASAKNCKCKVILMSGTSEPLKKLIPKETQKKDIFKDIDHFKQCNHVEPKTVTIRQENRTAEAAKEVKKYYEKGQRVIYFTSSIGHIIQLIKDLGKLGITEDVIGVAFTSEDKLNEFSTKMIERRKQIEDSLKECELLPDDVSIFLTTTKCKEGINIQNDDIKIMFAESAQRAELVQMAGRIRKGLDKLIVMCNLSRNNNDVMNKWRRYFAKETLDHINSTYETFIAHNDWPTKKQIIDDIEKSFPYVRYDFFRQKFLLFEGKMLGEDLAKEDRDSLDEWINLWDNKITPGEEDFQKWFPYSTVSLAEKPPTEDEITKKIITKYFEEHGELLEKVISKEERDCILADLNIKLKEQISSFQEKKQLNSLLKKVGYKVEEVGKHGKGQYRIQLLTETEVGHKKAD